MSSYCPDLAVHWQLISTAHVMSTHTGLLSDPSSMALIPSPPTDVAALQRQALEVVVLGAEKGTSWLTSALTELNTSFLRRRPFTPHAITISQARFVRDLEGTHLSPRPPEGSAPWAVMVSNEVALFNEMQLEISRAWIKEIKAMGVILVAPLSIMRVLGVCSASQRGVGGDLEERSLRDCGDLIVASDSNAWGWMSLRLLTRAYGRKVLNAVLTEHQCRMPLAVFTELQLPDAWLAHGDTVVLEAQQRMHAVHGVGITVEEIAALSGIAERTLVRRFSYALGMPPSEYAMRLRVAWAQRMLAAGLKQDHARHACGYTHLSAFSRSFIRHTGLRPSRYYEVQRNLKRALVGGGY